MKTVLPDRESPVTPRRIVGLTRFEARSARLSSAIRASPVRDVRLGGKAEFRLSVLKHIGRGCCPKKKRRERRSVVHEVGKLPPCRRAVEIEDCKARRGKAVRQCTEQGIVTDERFKRLLGCRVVTDKHDGAHRSGCR